MTSPNSYLFVWTDAAINRDTNNLSTAVLELFRNGDTCVTTNETVDELPEVAPVAAERRIQILMRCIIPNRRRMRRVAPSRTGRR